MALRKLFLVSLLGCILLTGSALGLTTQVIPSQDISFRSCEGVNSASLLRTLDIFGSSCMNGLLRMDLSVLGSAGLVHTSSITLELPLLNAVSSGNLIADYQFSAAAGSWSESSNLAALSAVSYSGSASVALSGQGLASFSLTLPSDLVATPILEVRLSTDASGAISAASTVQVGSRRQSSASNRARARVVSDAVCSEAASEPTS